MARTLPASNASVYTLAFFLLVGEPPQTRHFGSTWPEVWRRAAPCFPSLHNHRLRRIPRFCVISLSLNFLVFLSFRYTEQAVYVRLYRNGFPHFFLRGALFRITGFFLCRKPAPFHFERVHLRQLCAIQKLPHGSLCRPVNGKLRFVCRKIFSAIFFRIVFLKYRPRFCIIHSCLFECDISSFLRSSSVSL